MTEVSDHLRRLGLGEQLEARDCHRKHKNSNTIPQLDSIEDSTDSLSQTPDSVDLTISPVKHKNTKADKECKNTSTNDEDDDEAIDVNKGKTPRRYTKDKNPNIDSKKKDEHTNDNDINTPVKGNKGKSTKV